MRRRAVCFLAVAALLGAACASKRVLVPPRVDLSSHGTLGMIEFSANGSPELAELATNQFLAVIQGAQPGVPILELGDSRGVLAALDREAMGPETVQAIGRKYGVDAVLLGKLTTEQVKPSFSVSSFVESMNASADIEGTLSARILQTRTGATVWANAARGKESVAQVNLARGSRPQIGARDPDGAESRLVRRLVAALSDDFKPRWERR